MRRSVGRAEQVRAAGRAAGCGSCARASASGGAAHLAGEEPVVQVHPHAGYRQAAADDSEGRERCERHSLPVRVPRKRGSD